MPADLHVHSNISDGTNTPEEIVELARSAGLKTIALTDHDEVAGISRAQKVGGVEVIPGIELTSETPASEIHILGYFIDQGNSRMLSVLDKIKKDRRQRIYKIVEKLKALGVSISAEDIFALAGKGVVGRPHVARVLMRAGVVPDFKSAFNKYLDFRAPAYVSHYKLSPEEAIRLVREAGGLAVFAHPSISKCDAEIPNFLAAGLKGIEAYYPGYTPMVTRHYKNLAKKYGLLITGGSDFHGSDSGREVGLGEVSIPDELVDKLKDEHLRGNKS